MKNLVYALLILLVFFDCVNSQTVTIGTQIWCKKNLDVKTFQNGDTIHEAQTNSEWINAIIFKEPAWCYYENNSDNGQKYGLIYNIYAVNDPRGLAPEGFHIPSDEEWTILVDFLGGENIAGGKIKSKTGWVRNGNGTDEYGFNGLPGGIKGKLLSSGLLGYNSYWWCSQENGDNPYRFLVDYDSTINKGEQNESTGSGFYVRCIKD
jgi:uncharacterized protein (TIGR02145 family)